jgi:hypothetical protein
MMLNIPVETGVREARSAYEVCRSFLGYEPGLVVVIEVYMDESGVHGGSAVVTSSAVWARPSVWQKWTRAWCRAKHPIDVFHASECSNRKGEFSGWSREDRDRLVLRLLPTFSAHKLHGRFEGIHVEALNRCLESAPDVNEEFGDPYFACIHWAFKHVCQHAAKTNTTRIAFVHENSNDAEYVLHAFNYTRSKFPKLQLTLAFGGKKDYVPLQAADLIAYEGYKFLEGGGVERKPMAALDPTGKRMMKAVYGKDSAALLAVRLRSELQPLIERRKRTSALQT